MILKLFFTLNILLQHFSHLLVKKVLLHHPNPKLKVYIQIIQKTELGYRSQKEQRKSHFMLKQKIQKPSYSG